MSTKSLKGAYPYLQIICKTSPKVSKKLFSKLFEESGDGLIKAVSQLVFGYLFRYSKGKLLRDCTKAERKFLERLADKKIPLAEKRKKLVSQRGLTAYKFLPDICRVMLKNLSSLLRDQEKEQAAATPHRSHQRPRQKKVVIKKPPERELGEEEELGEDSPEEEEEDEIEDSAQWRIMARRVVKEIGDGKFPISGSSGSGYRQRKSVLNREIVELDKEQKNAIIYNMPAKYKTSAKSVLEKIWPYIDLTEENEVLYPSILGGGGGGAGGNGLERGSNIIFLLKYFLVKNSGQPKPLDSKKFLRILQLAGVKKSLLRTNKKLPLPIPPPPRRRRKEIISNRTYKRR